ncbi:hypothetical protein Tco_1422808 [Tanacetum coccineum]
MDLDFVVDENLRELSGEEVWEAIGNFAQGQKEWDNPPNIISEQELANLNTCNHDIPLSSREVPIFNELEPQPQPLPNFPSLDVSLGDKRGTEPPTKPHSPDSFRIKVVDNLTINTPPSPHVVSFHPKDTYCYYHPCIDDPKKHYGFKPGLLGQSGSLESTLEVSLYISYPADFMAGVVVFVFDLQVIFDENKLGSS